MVKILVAPDPILRQKAKPVLQIDKKILKTVEEMREILAGQSDPPGVGLAAPQIGVGQQIILVAQKASQIRKKKINSPTYEVFLNPRVLQFLDEEKEGWEGCLSVPKIYGFVKRPPQVKIQAENLTGKKIKRSLRGLSARIFQHEVDHLNGVLFVDRILSQGGKLYKMVGKDKEGKDRFQEVALS